MELHVFPILIHPPTSFPIPSLWSSNNRLTANNCILSTLCTLLTVSSVSRRGAPWSPTLCLYHSFHPLCGWITVPPFAKIIYLLCKISLFLPIFLSVSVSTISLAPSLICCVTLRQSFPPLSLICISNPSLRKIYFIQTGPNVRTDTWRTANLEGFRRTQIIYTQ